MNHVGPLRKLFLLYRWRAALIIAMHAWWTLRGAFLSQAMTWKTPKSVIDRKRSDTIFVFGSGASLNDLAEAEWRRIEAHNTVGCNYFIHQDFIELDYQHFDTLYGCGSILREESCIDGRIKVKKEKYHAEAARYAAIVAENPRLRPTLFFLPVDFFNRAGLVLLSKAYLPRWVQAVAYKTRYNGHKRDGMRQGPPTAPHERMAGGLSGALCIAAAYGWRNLVLVGVDLYDSRYFFLPPDQTRAKGGAGDPDAPHPNVAAGRLPWIDNWERALRAEGRRIMIYNPKSLLADRLEQFSWDKIDPPYAEAAERREQPVGTDD